MRLLVLSDVHADAGALDRVLARAGGEWDRLVLLGDLIGYGHEPAEVVARLRSMDPLRVVRGNHEAMLDRLLDGDVPRAAPSVLEALRAHAEALPPDDLAWLRSLPERAVLDPDPDPDPDADAPALDLVHGSPNLARPYDYLLGVADARRAEAYLQRPWLLYGHTHVPGGFVRAAGRWRPIGARRSDTTVRLHDAEIALLNPGSVAEARDGGPGGCSLILDLTERVVVVTRTGEVA